jgi:hypothetical protein
VSFAKLVDECRRILASSIGKIFRQLLLTTVDTASGAWISEA